MEKSASIPVFQRNWLLLRRRSREIGWVNAIRLRWIDFRNKYFTRLGFSAKWPVLRTRVPGYPTPIYMRTGSSDYTVLRQVFIDREYEIPSLADPRTIIDCGANVGYASVHFLTRFPNVKVIAVEPDPGNAAICRKNLEPFGHRATLIESGVWSRPCRLALVPKDKGDEWGVQVREAANGEAGDLDSIDVPYLLEKAGEKRVDLLKIDIEWSELELFKPGAAPWLEQVDNIAIELHDDRCERVFFAAMEPYRYDEGRSGELTLCMGIQPRPAATEDGLSAKAS